MKTRSHQQPAESSHDELQRTLASIVEFSDDAIISKTLDGIVTTWNKAAERMFGYTAEEMIGSPISILAPSDKVSEMPQILERIRAGERVEHYETVRLHKDGHPVAISLTVSPLRDQGGRIVGASKIARDINKAHEESRFRRLLEAAPDAILEVDVQGQIVLINQVAETMFGYSREELLRMNVESLVPAAMRGKHHGHRAAYTAAPQTRPMGVGLELKAQRKDGSLFPIEIRLSPNWTGGVLHVIALVRDISERKESQDRIRAIQERYAAQLFAANQQLEARNEEVEKANRLKSEFLASMSHELRTPLHTIIGFSELLTEELEGPLNAKQKRFLGHILQDSRHLLELINEVLDISKIEAGRLELHNEAIDFSVCVGEVLAGIQPQAIAKNIQLENRNTFTGLLYADRLRIKEILYNLLSNAIKFTSNGGLVWIESIADESFLRVTVGDNGIGIPLEEQAAIFETFYQAGNTTSGVREGTGLGLPITKKLVELHGGRIWVESQSGQGSRFMVILPLQGR